MLECLLIQAHEVLFDALLSCNKDQSVPDATTDNQQSATSSSSSTSVTLASPTSVCNDASSSVHDESDNSTSATTSTVLTVNMRLRRSAASQYCVPYTTYTAAVSTDWHLEGEVRLKASSSYTTSKKVRQS